MTTRADVASRSVRSVSTFADLCDEIVQRRASSAVGNAGETPRIESAARRSPVTNLFQRGFTRSESPTDFASSAPVSSARARAAISG